MTERTQLHPLAAEDWPEDLSVLADAFAGRLNVYRVMAHHPALLRAWAALRQHIVVQNSLGPTRNEIVILRAAVHLKSDYEWNHHVSRARAIGISDQRIASMRGEPSDMLGEDALMARAVDDLMDSACLHADRLAALHAAVGVEATLDLIATVGFYATLGFLVRSYDVPLDAAISGELAGDPLARGT